MGDDGLELLYTKNKFLREIENAPPSDKTKLILLWDVEQKKFSTQNFHPSKIHYRISVDEIKRVD